MHVLTTKNENQKTIDSLAVDLRDKALSYFNDKDFNAALNCFKEAEEYKNLDNKDYYLMGLIYEHLEKVDEAQNCFYIALRKLPKNKKYLSKFTDYMISHNLEINLLTKLERIIVLRSGIAIEIQDFLINYYLKNKKYDKALKVALEANFFNADNSHFLKKIVKIYDKKKAYKQGLQVASQLAQLDTKDFEANMLLANMRLKNNIDEYPPAEDIYNFLDVNNDSDSTTLTIVLSSLKGKFMLKNYPFNTDKLFVSEQKMTFYTFAFNNLVSYLLNKITNKKYKKVNIVGYSKGAFAAINVGVNLAQKLNDVDFNIIAFSPQTQLYPLNKNIEKLPSYNTLIKLSTQNISVSKALESFGNLEQLSTRMTKNIKITVLYGELYERDKNECLRIKNIQGITLKPIIGCPFHTTLILFVKKGEDLVNGLMSKIQKNVKDDDDYFKQDNSEELTHKFMDSIKNSDYELNDYLI